jgi:hypothetical protein
MRRTLPAFQRIMRLSERTVGQGYELKVKDIMTGVRQQVLKQPGLINVETLVDTSDPNKCVIYSIALTVRVTPFTPSHSHARPPDFCVKQVEDRLRVVPGGRI